MFQTTNQVWQYCKPYCKTRCIPCLAVECASEITNWSSWSNPFDFPMEWSSNDIPMIFQCWMLDDAGCVPLAAWKHVHFGASTSPETIERYWKSWHEKYEELQWDLGISLHQEMAACAHRAHVNTGSWLLPKLDELCLGTWMNVVDMIWYVDIIYIRYMICMIWCWNVAKDHLAQRKNMETCILWQQLMSSTSARS